MCETRRESEKKKRYAMKETQRKISVVDIEVKKKTHTLNSPHLHVSHQILHRSAFFHCMRHTTASQLCWLTMSLEYAPPVETNTKKKKVACYSLCFFFPPLMQKHFSFTRQQNARKHLYLEEELHMEPTHSQPPRLKLPRPAPLHDAAPPPRPRPLRPPRPPLKAPRPALLLAFGPAT